MNRRNSLEYLALAALLVAFFGYFSVKVWDIDFWWHIAAGRNILATGTIPSVDPFGMYDAANACGQTVLKSEWIGQVVLYWVYGWLGLDGVIYSGAGVLTLCLAIVYLRCRIAASTGPFVMLVTALAGLAILHHTGERPQLFSFLLLSLLFLLLDSFIRTGKRWLLYCIPPLMLLWSNTHGAVLLGVAALGLFGITYVLENRWGSARISRTHASQNILMLMVVAVSVVILVTAPSGLDSIKCIISQQSGSVREQVSEYASPWSLWPVTLYYWVFIVVTLVSLPGFFDRIYLRQGALVVVLALISMAGFRYIPLFVLVAAPYVAASLSRMLSRFRLPVIAFPFSVLVIALVLLGLGFRQGKVFQRGLQEQRFPVGAVEFIKSRNLGGKMFNSMNWGGYLLWNLYGTTSLFIDGRTLDPYRVAPYTNILWTTPEGLRYFEQENFDLALVSYGNAFTGERHPIVAYLQNRPDWQLVYRDKAGVLFVRRAGK